MPEPTKPEDDRESEADDLEAQIEEIVGGGAGAGRGGLRDLADRKAAEHFRERARRESTDSKDDPDRLP